MTEQTERERALDVVTRVVTEADEDSAVDEDDLDPEAVAAEPEAPLPVEPEPIRPVDDPEPPATGAGQRPTTAG